MKGLEDALPDNSSTTSAGSAPNTDWADFSKMDSQESSSEKTD
jgi:hypothetical protein